MPAANIFSITIYYDMCLGVNLGNWTSRKTVFPRGIAIRNMNSVVDQEPRYFQYGNLMGVGILGAFNGRSHVAWGF